MTDSAKASLAQLSTDLVASFVSANKVHAQDLPALIRTVHATLSTLGQPEAAPDLTKPTTAQIRKSIRDEGLVSFEDGRSYSSLKRHLRTFGLTPQEYRAKWGLPDGYPMVAPAYSARRSELAKQAGLGRKSAAVALKPAPGEAPKRGRARKAPTTSA